ncbi:ATP-binding cassette domain-containing protein [bacterium]|nr:ATP-binding cassette domain-containing protein [bacterium]
MAEPFSDSIDIDVNVVDAKPHVRSETDSRRASLASLLGGASQKASGLHFRALQCEVKRKSDSKLILKDCNGSFPSGTVTAIMGPSGAGKTTFLEILGQRVHIKKSKVMAISGDVGLDKERMTCSLFRERCAFVPQHDLLWATLTPREHFVYSLSFRRSAGKQGTDDGLINRLLAQLGLSKCADTVAGGQFLKGCSGGQQRRTSIGIEIISQPELLLLDEPTSGLDAHSALSITTVLAYLAKRMSMTIALTIHQPSTYVWDAFNLVMVSRLAPCAL